MHQAVTRPVDLARDRERLLQLDTSFVSTSIYEVHQVQGDELILAAIPVTIPVTKRFPLNLEADSWERGWVVEDEGAIHGFLACELDKWNRRLIIWHYYVDINHRRRGLGHLLMGTALAWGRDAGAITAWIETTNLNYPGVCAYRSLGFNICGFDLSLYRGTANEGEFALFLARNL